jgi:hypothetical protein
MAAATLHQEIRQILESYSKLNLADWPTLIHNLRFIYHTMRASESMLAVAAELSTDALRAYYLAHLEEERGHDEWLFEDLESSGESAFPCPPAAAEIAGAQYYHLMHTNPASLLGYMMVLEGFPMAEEDLATLEAIHGKTILRTIRYHSTHDIGHLSDLFLALDSLSDLQQAVARNVAIYTAHAIAKALTGGPNA